MVFLSINSAFAISAMLILSTILGSVSAMWPHSKIIGNVCQVVSGNNFDACSKSEEECLCTNPNYLATVALCINQNLNTTKSVDEAWNFVLLDKCKQTLEVAEKAYKSAMRLLNQTNVTVLNEESNPNENYTNPVIPSKESVKDTYTSIYINLYNRDIGTWQGSALVLYWVVVIGIAGIYRLWRYIMVSFAPKRQSMGRPNRLMRMYYKHIKLPATFGLRHIDRYYLFGFIPVFIPTRYETILISIYMILTIIFMCCGYVFMNNNPLWNTHYSELVLNVSNRAGIIAAIQIPLLTLFALRNNILIWITGWSYSSFNAYHRGIARITFLLGVTHAAAKHSMMLTFGMPLRMIYYPTVLFRLGTAALVIWIFMILLGFFRVRFYEIFLFFHVLGAISAYICLIYHLHGLGYKQTVYIALGFILADIIIRVTRIVFSNASIILKPIEGSKSLTKANVSLLASDVINVRIRTPIQWPFAPGQYVYIHFNRINIFESHPFSAVGPSSDGESFQLLCKARGGITKRVKEYLEKEGASATNGRKIKMNVLIEGPYGVHCPVERYDTVLLVAGGIGITGIIPYAEYLALSPNYHDIILIWTVSTVDELTWIEERLQWLSETAKAKIKLYVTRVSKKIEQPVDSTNVIVMKELGVGHNTTPMELAHKRSGETDSFRLVGEGINFQKSYDNGVKRKLSIRKHIRNISQNSNVFAVDIDQRMENVDGGDMVDWTHNEGQAYPHQHLRTNSRGQQIYTQLAPPIEEESEGSKMGCAYKMPRQAPNNYRNSYRYSYNPTKRNSAIFNNSSDIPSYDGYAAHNIVPPPHAGVKGDHKISINEISRQQLWMDNIIEGTRPNLMETVSELFREAPGSVCIVGCGPARMMDTLRKATCLNYDLVQHGRLDYFEEAFTW